MGPIATEPVRTDVQTPVHDEGNRVSRLFHSLELLRYAITGAFNTLFGYACYAAFVALYKHFLPPRYLYLTVDLASLTATPIGVTMSFLTYKLIVFRTKGNYVREYMKCFLVYGAAMLPGLVLLPIVTKLLIMARCPRDVAPYLAGAIVMGGTAMFTYVAHKKFSFSKKRGGDATTLAAQDPAMSWPGV